MPELICEGRCNPQLERVDRAVRDYRQADGEASNREDGGRLTLPPVYPGLRDALRALTHTRHIHASHDRWACAVCRPCAALGHASRLRGVVNRP